MILMDQGLTFEYPETVIERLSTELETTLEMMVTLNNSYKDCQSKSLFLNLTVQDNEMKLITIRQDYKEIELSQNQLRQELKHLHASLTLAEDRLENERSKTQVL